MEEWRDIKDYEGYYQVSSMGRIRSVDRIEKINSYTRVKKGKILKLHLYTNGYAFIALTKDNIRKQYLVHRLVAQAFMPNQNNLPEINHKDENKTNNCVDNLEWCSHTYNSKYNDRHKKIGKQLINRGDLSKTVYQYKNYILVNVYPSASEAARDNNINVSNVIQCCKGGFMLHGKWVNKHTIHGYKYSY